MDEVGSARAQRLDKRSGEEVQVGEAPLWPGAAERQVLRSVGDQVVGLAVGVMAEARPAPVARGTNQPGSDWVQVAVAHHFELVTAILDAGRAQPLHDDLSAALGPPIVPAGKAPVDDLPEGAEGLL